MVACHKAISALMMAAEIHYCNEFNIHSVVSAGNSIFGNQPKEDNKIFTVKQHDALIKIAEKITNQRNRCS